MTVNRTNVLRFYDGGHGANTNPAATSRAVSWLARRDRALMFDLLAPAQGLSALDAGCGAGHHARELAARGLRVTAIDCSPRQVARVAPFVEAAAVADIEQLALEHTFDRVLCAGVLEFVADPDGALVRLADHVAPRGRLVVMVPRRSIGGRAYRYWQRRTNAITVHLFTAWQLDRVAATRGLSLLAHARPFLHSLVMAWERLAL